MSRYFHGTTRAAARAILSEGWKDSREEYLTDTEHPGVWLSDRPDDRVLLVVEIPNHIVEPHEWIAEGYPYREFLVPAALLNQHGKVMVAERSGDTRNEPVLPPSVHLGFLPTHPPGRPCVICLAPKPDFCCERCGVPFHGDCHYRHAATEDERDRILTVPQDWPGVNLLIMLCSGCRS